MDEFMLISGRANPALAEKISAYLDVPLCNTEVFKFANDNTFVKINDNIRKRDVFVIQPTCRPVNDNLMELLIIMDACRRASARSITAVVPHYAYARSDKKDQPRVAITAKLVADMITVAGADRMVTIDLHAEAIQGFFNIPVDHLYAMPAFIDKVKQWHVDDNVVIVSPDAGGVQRARAYAKRVPAALAIIDKRRVGNEDRTETLHVIGDVAGKICVIVDDIIDTAGSLTAAAEALTKEGATEVYAAATHAVFSGPAVDRINQSALKEVFVTDTIPLPVDKQSPKVTVLTISEILGEAIRRIVRGDSVSSLFV